MPIPSYATECGSHEGAGALYNDGTRPGGVVGQGYLGNPILLTHIIAVAAPLAMFLACSAPVFSAEIVTADVVVYTATASGVASSVAAAREGMKVVLVEPGRHVGGMLSGGLGHSDVLGQKEIIGGLAAEVFRRMAQQYGKGDIKDAFDFEPHVA